MNGKEYVIESIEIVGTIISAIKEKKLLDGDAAVADDENTVCN